MRVRFDAAGNATTVENAAHSYNADNQLTGPGSYEYDGNGNPVTWNGVPLTFDSENRLLAYGNVLTAAYRGDGLRAWKQTASGRRYFLYDGINVVCELDSDGEIIAESVFGAAGLVSRGEVQYQFDPLGDAVHLLDANGEVLAHRLFDAWGNELSTGITDPRGYRAQHGYYTDQETGLVALAYRYYAPGVGRFLNRDQIGYAGGVGLYNPVRNCPVASTDPSGLYAGPEYSYYWYPPPGWPRRDLIHYGHYCGPNREPPKDPGGSPATPYDELDACCQLHDECFKRNRCTVLNQLFGCGCRECNRALERCMSQPGICDTSPRRDECLAYRRGALAFYLSWPLTADFTPPPYVSPPQQALPPWGRPPFDPPGYAW